MEICFQSLKDLMREGGGEVSFADVDRDGLG
jgi:hypothetical protein